MEFLKVATKNGHAALRPDSIVSIIDTADGEARIVYRALVNAMAGGSDSAFITSSWSTERVLNALEEQRGARAVLSMKAS